LIPPNLRLLLPFANAPHFLQRGLSKTQKNEILEGDIGNAPMPYDLTQVKILIVEDLQPMLQLTTSLITMFGFKTVHGAKSVDEGYRLFCQNNHDLIITDWLMEPYDGIELIKRIRRNDDSPNKFVPVILMTGYSDQPRVETARDTGVTEFLMKPYTARDLYARIVQIIEKPRQFVDTGEFFGPDRRRRKNFEFFGENRREDSKADFSSAAAHDPEMEVILKELKEDAKKI
jgi:two-component system, chemotaxis family, chemotaxis protein CheY